MEKYHERKNLDMTYARRCVWLVKVPKYLSDSWKAGKPGSEVGQLKIVRKAGVSSSDITFTLNEALRDEAAAAAPALASGSKDLTSKVASKIPLEHKFAMIPLGPQRLTVLSTELLPDTSAEPEESDDQQQGGEGEEERREKLCEGRVSMVGTVKQRAECRPLSNDSFYLTHIRSRMEISNRPVNGIIQLVNTVNNYKPVSAHPHNLAAQKKKKEEGKKTRLEKDHVKNVLFAAFEKHQYYNVQDLVRITQQPITFLKEVLKEICTYNMKAPNKNTWELKAEYRHYKSQAPPSATAPPANDDDDDDDDDDDNLEEVL